MPYHFIVASESGEDRPAIAFGWAEEVEIRRSHVVIRGRQIPEPVWIGDKIKNQARHLSDITLSTENCVVLKFVDFPSWFERKGS